ncbi:DNA topoisomerase 6 subunit B [Asimina triloba]
MTNTLSNNSETFLMFIYMRNKRTRNTGMGLKFKLLLKETGLLIVKNVTIRFARRTDVMPPVPLETKHHPSAVDLLLIKRLAAETSKESLLQFLQHEFVSIGKSYAEREMGPEFNPKMSVKSLTSQQVVRIRQLFRQAKFDDPSGDCLSPAGEYNLRLGIIKELHPDMVATYASSPQVFEGHPFIVEAGVSLGGKDVKQGLNIFRFANRIPLLFEQGADVVTRTAQKRIKYVPDVSRAIYEVLKEMAQGREKKQRVYEGDNDEILKKVSTREITEATLWEKLTQHVEQVDYEMALEYAAQSGVSEQPREDIYIQSLEGTFNFIDLHSPVYVFRVIH